MLDNDGKPSLLQYSKFVKTVGIILYLVLNSEKLPNSETR